MTDRLETQAQHSGLVGIDELLGGYDRDAFFENHWEKRSFHRSHADPSRFSHLISVDQFFASDVFSCAQLKRARPQEDGWYKEQPLDPAEARQQAELGHTICATMLDPAGDCGQLIAGYKQDIISAASFHVNAYYSPEGAGYPIHFDTHPVWILQVEGRKHWTVGLEPQVRDPMSNVLFPPDRKRVKLPWITLDRPDVEDDTRFMQVCLDPGDVLYIPAGTWHAARAEGYSLALTLAMERFSGLDLLHLLMYQVAFAKYPELTRRLSAIPRGHESTRHGDEVRARLVGAKEQLKHILDQLDGPGLMAFFEALARHPEMRGGQSVIVDRQAEVEWMKSTSKDD